MILAVSWKQYLSACDKKQPMGVHNRDGEKEREKKEKAAKQTAN